MDEQVILKWIDNKESEVKKSGIVYTHVFTDKEKAKSDFDQFIEILQNLILHDIKNQDYCGLFFLNDYSGFKIESTDNLFSNWNTINGKPYIKPESKHL